MPFFIGPVELADHEAPSQGSVIQFGARGLWQTFNPVGGTGRPRQYLGKDANDHELHIICGEVTMLALKALMGPAAWAISFPRPTLFSGINVTVDEVDARWTQEVPGEWTAAELAATLGDNPTGDALGLYDVILKVTELISL